VAAAVLEPYFGGLWLRGDRLRPCRRMDLARELLVVGELSVRSVGALESNDCSLRLYFAVR